MTRRKTTFLALLLLTLAGIFVGVTLYKQSQKAEAQERYAVILSLDGFRYMYLDELSTPNLDAMVAEGVSGSLQPSYPSNTFPNHYSMATGLYPEHHGIVNNRFWVDELNDYYKLGDSARVYNPAFYGGEPIWNTAEKQGIKAGSYFWVGSETAVQNMRPSYWKKYDAETSFTARADSVIAWLQKPIEERPRLITWYIQEPDHTGHTYGTGSDQLKAMVSTVDSVVGYFRSELAKLPIASQVDFIIVSDHGMKDYEPDKIINLMDYLPADSFRYIVDGTPTLLYTKHPEYIDEAMKVLEKVPHVTAYRRADVPARFHYSEGDRLGDIVVMPELGGYIFFREKPELKLPAGHGFDNTLPEMQAIFFGVGPSFAKGKKVSQVPNVAIYPLLCHILQLTPAPNDGTEEDVQKLLGH